ncbi:MAG: glycosyltransferase family 4 protein [Planctomycetota bacterium]
MNRPIAYLTSDPGIPPDGHKGASVHFRALAQAFACIGQDLDVFVARDGGLGGFLPHRATVVPTPRAQGLAAEVLQIGHAGAMLRALQQNGPHAAVYERLSLFGTAGLAHARSSGVPYAVEVDAPLWREAATYRGLAFRGTARGICVDVMRQADLVFAVSQALADELIAEGVPAAHVQVLGNGADLARFQGARPAAKPAALRGRPTLLFVGSLKPWHGIDFLLRAFAGLRAQRPCGLWIVGDGPGRAEVEVAQRAFPGDIVLEGAVDHERVPALLQAADLVVAPYTGAAPAYFSPLKVVEALAAGRPLLASRVPCVLEALAGHEPMGLFAPDDVADFVHVAERMLAAGPAAATAGIDRARVARLDWSTHARHLRDLLFGVTAAAPRTEVCSG